jgi:hypothetical protein
VRVEWKYFLDDVEGEPPGPNKAFLPQPSYRIDTSLGNPLGTLPFTVARAQPLFGSSPQEARSLPVRNLLRGHALGLPSGQDVAAAMGITPIDIAPPPPAPPTATLDERARIDAARSLLAPDSRLRENTPLWYYVLKEAEAHEGHHLGPVGGRIVAEVLIGLLCGDPLSYLAAAPNWVPDLGPVPGRFTLSDLINKSRQARPLFG